MKDATLAQGNQVLNLILQKKVTANQLQELLGSGLLTDLLITNVNSINRREFQRFLGLSPLVETYEVLSVENKLIEKMINEDGYYRTYIGHFLGSAYSAVPKGLVLPQPRIVGQKRKLLLLDMGVEDFLSEDDEDIDRNITELEVLREMKKRGYTPCGLGDLVDLMVAHPRLRTTNNSIIAFQSLVINGIAKSCSIVWQSGHLAIRDRLDGNCGNNCRFLAIRQF